MISFKEFLTEARDKHISLDFGPIIHQQGDYKIHRITDPQHLANVSKRTSWCTRETYSKKHYGDSLTMADTTVTGGGLANTSTPFFALTHKNKPVIGLSTADLGGHEDLDLGGIFDKKNKRLEKTLDLSHGEPNGKYNGTHVTNPHACHLLHHGSKVNPEIHNFIKDNKVSYDTPKE